MTAMRPTSSVLRPILLAAAAVVALLGAAPAQAQQTLGSTITLGAGVGAEPRYFGSDDYEVRPKALFRVESFNLGGLTFGSPDRPVYEPGFRLGGSFRYIPSRKAADNPELAGLPDVDATFEIGLGASHVTETWRLFGTVRYGAFGHEGLVADLGGDVIWRPTDRLTMTLGPRAEFGDGRFVRTYFGVPTATANFAAYDPSGGLVSTGAEAGFIYRLDDRWSVEGAARYDRLRGDAGDSPIVERGSRDQLSVRLGVARRIQFGF